MCIDYGTEREKKEKSQDIYRSPSSTASITMVWTLSDADGKYLHITSDN